MHTNVCENGPVICFERLLALNTNTRKKRKSSMPCGITSVVFVIASLTDTRGASHSQGKEKDQ